MSKIMIAAARGRSDGEWFKSEHNQRLEMRDGKYSNTITHVAKDNYIVEYEQDKYYGQENTKTERQRMGMGLDKRAVVQGKETDS